MEYSISINGDEASLVHTIQTTAQKAQRLGNGYAFGLWQDNFDNSRFKESGEEIPFDTLTNQQKIMLIGKFKTHLDRVMSREGDLALQKYQANFDQFVL